MTLSENSTFPADRSNIQTMQQGDDYGKEAWAVTLSDRK
jgi:hypothetical protein